MPPILQTIRNGVDVINYTKAGKLLRDFCRENASFMIENIEAGFMDGGCLPLALALKAYLATALPGQSARIISVGRCRHEHAVVELQNTPFGVVFLDGDGLGSAAELRRKMLKVESLSSAKIYDFNFEQDEVLSYEEIGLPAALLRKMNRSEKMLSLVGELRQIENVK